MQGVGDRVEDVEPPSQGAHNEIRFDKCMAAGVVGPDLELARSPLGPCCYEDAMEVSQLVQKFVT
jgi:hypothetical protein